MPLYLLTRKDQDSVGYDECDSKIVRANSSDRARFIANQKGNGDEGPIWDNEDLVLVVELSPSGDEKIILRSFNAG